MHVMDTWLEMVHVETPGTLGNLNSSYEVKCGNEAAEGRGGTDTLFDVMMGHLRKSRSSSWPVTGGQIGSWELKGWQSGIVQMKRELEASTERHQQLWKTGEACLVMYRNNSFIYQTFNMELLCEHPAGHSKWETIKTCVSFDYFPIAALTNYQGWWVNINLLPHLPGGPLSKCVSLGDSWGAGREKSILSPFSALRSSLLPRHSSRLEVSWGAHSIPPATWSHFGVWHDIFTVPSRWDLDIFEGGYSSA